jgi:hypothetical protein
MQFSIFLFYLFFGFLANAAAAVNKAAGGQALWQF